MCKCKRKWDCVYVGLVVGQSLHGKAARLLHGRQQFLVEFLVRLVGRDVYPVETRDGKGQLFATNIKEEGQPAFVFCVSSPCVSLGQVVCVGVYQVDGEEPWSCRTCRTLHTYILVITALLWCTEHSPSQSGEAFNVIL